MNDRIASDVHPTPGVVIESPGGSDSHIGHAPDIQPHSGISGAGAIVQHDASATSHNDSVARRIRYVESIKKYVLGLVNGNPTVNGRGLPRKGAQIKRVLTKQGDAFIASAGYEDGRARTCVCECRPNTRKRGWVRPATVHIQELRAQRTRGTQQYQNSRDKHPKGFRQQVTIGVHCILSVLDAALAAIRAKLRMALAIRHCCWNVALSCERFGECASDMKRQPPDDGELSRFVASR